MTAAPLSLRFDDALLYACEHHRDQVRKGSGIPYVSHLLSVAALVLEMQGTEDEAIGALLHDVIEDGGGERARVQIRERFGLDVEAIVLANTDTTVEPKPPWHLRKEAYIAGIPGKHPAALRVSLADKLHNARSILLDLRTHGDDLWARFSSGEGASVRWYYRSLVEEFEARREVLGERAEPALDELRRTVDEIDRITAG